MDEQVLERARQRVAEARTEGIAGARLDAALERARAEVMRLAQVADELETSLPKQVGIAVRDGIAREVVPVSRSLAEIRGGVNQALRRLERLEEELLAERNAAVDGLAILVDLVSAGWSGVDRRLKRLEDGIEGAVVPLPTGREEETLSPAERAGSGEEALAEGEYHGARGRPDGDRDEQRQVLDEERLRLLAEAAPVEQQQVSEEPVDDERDGRDEPARVVRRERVPRGRVAARRRDDREQLVHEGDAVAVERRTRVDAVEPELGAALTERDEEREQERAEQEPLRDADVDGDRARRRAQDEEPRDREHVDELEGLEAEGVGRLQGDERGEAGERRRPECARERERRARARPGEHPSGPRGELAAGDGTRALDGMEPVGLGIAHVVHEVRRARRRAVGEERRHGRGPARRVAELRGEDDAREEQQVLRPLTRPHGDERRGGRGV